MQNRNELSKRIRAWIEKHHMIADGDHLCVGCSGGADSVYLLLFLHHFSMERIAEHESGRFQISVCHINHGLRGQESDEDELFVRNLCERLQIPFYAYSFRVDQIAKERRIGLEEAGRYARFHAFERCMEMTGANKLVLAHHLDDQAETILFHLVRGSGLAGLAGIRPVTWLRLYEAGKPRTVIRPLLSAHKEEVISALQEAGQEWRTDSTNAETEVVRNRIRQNILPILIEEVNSSAAVHISRFGETAAEADEYFNILAQRMLNEIPKNAAPGQREVLLTNMLQHEPMICLRYLIIKCFQFVTEGLRDDLMHLHVEAVADLFHMQIGKQLDLPYAVTAIREYEGIRLSCKHRLVNASDALSKVTIEVERAGNKEERAEVVVEKAKASEETEQADALDCLRLDGLSSGPSVYIFGDQVFEMEILEADSENISASMQNHRYTKSFDYDKIGDNLQIRFRRPGDFLRITQEGGRKKLKQYMIDEKIPRDKRDKIPLLASDSEVWWITGYRMSEGAKVTEQTGRILRIRTSNQ